jgi:hypothetical protein
MMPRILLSILVLSVSAWSQIITVFSPAAGAVWKQGETKTIQWTKQGETGATVRIALRAPGQTDAVLEIADPAPNTGSYSWTIPATVAPATYIIRVRSKSNNQATDDSDQFQIQANDGSTSSSPFKRMKTPAAAGKNRPMKIKINVTGPPESRQYTLGDTINVVFKTDLLGPYVLDLMREDGTTLFRSFGEYGGTSAGPGTQLVQVLSGMFPEPRIKTGWYRIRVCRAQGPGSGVGNRIHIARKTREVLVQLQPVIRDRHSRRRDGTDHDVQPDNWTEASKPGLARAGADFRYFQVGNGYGWVGFIFRTQVTFPVETVSPAGRTLKEAWIFIEENFQRDASFGDIYAAAPPPVYMPSARGWKVYGLTGPWDGNCIDTPGYQIGEIPRDADKCSVHLDDLAKGWLAGTKPNHGLIIGSRFEPFDNWVRNCFMAISWYKVTLNLKFIEEI